MHVGRYSENILPISIFDQETFSYLSMNRYEYLDCLRMVLKHNEMQCVSWTFILNECVNNALNLKSCISYSLLYYFLTFTDYVFYKQALHFLINPFHFIFQSGPHTHTQTHRDICPPSFAALRGYHIKTHAQKNCKKKE